MLDRFLNNGVNPYKFDDGEDWSHEIPPLEWCQYLPAWDVRVVSEDDFKYDYGDVKQTDDGRFNYRDYNDPDWTPTECLEDVDGGDSSESTEYTEDIDLNDLAEIDENPYEYLLKDVDGGDEDEGGAVYTEDLDFCTLLYNIPEEYANIYSVTVYCIARILEDEIIKRTGDYKAKFEIHKDDYPEADPYLNIHVAINQRMNKVYVEFIENRKLAVLFGENRQRLGTVIANQLNQYYNLTTHNHHYKVEIIMPEDNYTFCCDSSQILTCHTISYWRSFVGKYSFLEDREEVKLDIAKKGYGYNRKEFYDKVHALNVEYSMDDSRHNMIPEVFERYRELYKEEFGYELPDFYEAYIRVSCKYDVLYRDNMYGHDYHVA